MSLRKIWIVVALFLLTPCCLPAQQHPSEVDSVLDEGFEKLDKKNNEALEIGFNCLEAAQKLSYKGGEAMAYTLIGRAYRRSGKYDKAIENQIEAFKIYEKEGDYLRVSFVCNNIAIIYILIHDYKKAVDYEEQALEAIKKAKSIKHSDSANIINIYNQLGAANFEMGKYPEAQINFTHALETSKLLKDSDGEFISLENLAKVYVYKKQYNEAIKYAREAQKVLGEDAGPMDRAYSLGLFGWIYGKSGQYNEAVRCLEQAYRIADSAGYLELKKEELKGLADSYGYLGNYKKAYYYQSLFTEMNDSILNSETNEKIIEMEAEYQFERKLDENKFLKKENILKEENLQHVRNQKKGLIAGLTVLFVLAGTIVYFLVKGNNRNRQLKTLVDEKNNIMSILSHEMRAPLIKINAVVDRKMNKNNGDKEFIAVRGIVDEGLSMLSNILDVNYLEGQSVKPKVTEIDVLELMQLCVEEVLDYANTKLIAIDLDVELDSIIIHSDRIMLKRIINNLVSNAIKYSFPSSQITIKVSATDDNYVLFSFADKGQGIKDDEKDKLFTKYAKLSAKPTAGETSTGLGLFISAWLVQLLKGEVWCDSTFNVGSTFYFKIPYSIQQLV